MSPPARRTLRGACQNTSKIPGAETPTVTPSVDYNCHDGSAHSTSTSSSPRYKEQSHSLYMCLVNSGLIGLEDHFADLGRER